MEQPKIEESQPCSDAPALNVEGVTVSYRSYRERPTSLKESVIRLLRDRTIKHYSTFDALHDVSFSVPRGCIFAIIGGNGSGKSTLLKVIARVLSPTRGSVQCEGTVASLIELGAGFDPELNAVENLYLHGSLHRKPKSHIASRVDEILAFAELESFSKTPIKYYSSGMFARLGFAAAIDIDPDILLVDEILGVGDERFFQKCQEVFYRFLGQGKTVVLVTHDMNLVEKKANLALLLSCGEATYMGTPAEAVALYRDPYYRSRLAAN